MEFKFLMAFYFLPLLLLSSQYHWCYVQAAVSPKHASPQLPEMSPGALIPGLKQAMGFNINGGTGQEDGKEIKELKASMKAKIGGRGGSFEGLKQAMGFNINGGTRQEDGKEIKELKASMKAKIGGGGRGGRVVGGTSGAPAMRAMPSSLSSVVHFVIYLSLVTLVLF